MVWPTLASGTAKEQNSTDPEFSLLKSLVFKKKKLTQAEHTDHGHVCFAGHMIVNPFIFFAMSEKYTQTHKTHIIIIIIIISMLMF